MSRSREQLENWLKTIEVKEPYKVLDIGGSQLPVRDRLLFFDNTGEYKILDLEIPHECKQKPDIIGDIQEIYEEDSEKGRTIFINGNYTNTDIYPEKNTLYSYFDVVFCIEVSEYWIRPLNALKAINFLLKKGGTLYISFHTLYGLHKPEGLVYLNYTRYGIEKLLKETGFEIEEIITKDISEDGRQALIEFYKAEGMKILYNNETFKEGYLLKCKKI